MYLTWLLPFLCYTEVNIIWAAHQTHHSSEDYNLTTALRQSSLLRYISWVSPRTFTVFHIFSSFTDDTNFLFFCKNYINQTLHVFSFFWVFSRLKGVALRQCNIHVYNFSYFLQIIEYYLIFIQEVYKLLWYIFMLYKCHPMLICTLYAKQNHETMPKMEWKLKRFG